MYSRINSENTVLGMLLPSCVILRRWCPHGRRTDTDCIKNIIIIIIIRHFNPKRPFIPAFSGCTEASTNIGEAAIAHALGIALPDVQTWSTINSSYLAYGEKDDDVIEDLTDKFGLLSASASWDPRARFVVAAVVTDVLYESQATAKRLLEIFSSEKILNVVVILKASQLQTNNSEMIKNNQIKRYEIYTWFPYQAPDRCSSVHDVILLDSWIVEGGGRFNNNINLFPDKIKYNFHGCPLIAATFPVDFVVGPYTHLNDSITSGTSYVTYDSGIELRFIKLVAEELNLTLRFLPPPPNNEKWGNLTNDLKFTGLLGEVVYERADIGFGAWPLHSKLLQIMDATKSYYRDDWVWWVPCAKKVPRWKSISMVFLPETWGALLISILFAVVVILCLVRCEKAEHKFYGNCANCVSSVWATVLGVATPHTPDTISVRMFFISWIWYCLAINVVFQTLLTSFLIEPGFEHQMNSIGEIMDSKLKYGYNQWFDIVVRDAADTLSETILQNRVQCGEGNEPPCLDWVAYHGNFSLLCSKTLLDYLLTREYLDKHGKPLICQAGGLFFPLNYVTYMAKGNPLLNRFDEMITRVIESGIAGNWIASGLYLQRVQAGITGRKILAGEYSNLSLEHAQGIFAILLPGLAFSVLVFFLELSYYKIPSIRAG
ncbi:hypothetical protein B7P43_G11113 [Cryptotermes secundus]|uniref:Ionotropic glutamate receptor C-terminal domain-containing protein n=1 Tax=Cryptotermes secundus TaxID=105785 RepID=A0A2J7RQ68_9NEOP|nr:hypothetical protein B7P43_G11113 [Cryptotermes secundus]